MTEYINYDIVNSHLNRLIILFQSRTLWVHALEQNRTQFEYRKAI